MVQANQFGGARVEDPKAHVVHFDRICQTIKMNGIPSDAIKLRLFPFSLQDQALSWLNSFPANHFVTWEQLYKALMQEYCPPSKAAKLKKLIQNFQQFGNENLYEAWKRFKELRRQCPKNLLTPGDFISSFYEGLLDSSKTILDMSSYGGIFMDKGPEHGEQIIERITSNTAYWYNEISEPPKKEKPAGMFEVDDKMAMQAQLNSIQHMLKQMMQNPKQRPHQSIAIVACCAICGGNHASQSCQLLDPSGQGSFSSMEQVDAIGFSRPQGQSFQGYGQQQRNQFGGQFGNQYGTSMNNQGRNPPPGFERNQGNMGGNQGNNWRVNQGQGQWNNQSGQGDKDKGKAPMQVESNESKKGAPKGKQTHDSVIPCNLLPFPQRLWKSKDTERENKFKMMLDKLEISMPFVDVVTQISSYKKFLKDTLSNKKKLENSAVVDMSEGALTCAVLQKHLPPKLKDPGSFAIPCIVGGFVVGRALCDLGASVSLMPYSLCKSLNLGGKKVPISSRLRMTYVAKAW
ncbi:uncharacterized protein LOC116023542 [Ipomoea triloba]|uniref:uncharacterized protein LOC116023542 n=1 Tax=Ipomoea triloba TaxID=35885 RepID=UPI00125E307C|nr:uncharacterized protein LOC116023542 [Ipomoea triloba]